MLDWMLFRLLWFGATCLVRRDNSPQSDECSHTVTCARHVKSVPEIPE